MQTRSHFDETQPFHIYLDISMINNDQKNGEPAPRLVYNEARNVPYILAPENYFCSVVRFYLESPSLPVFIPQVVIGQTDPSKTIYQFKLNNNGTIYIQDVVYFPQDKNLPVPNPPTTIQDLTTKYYYVYSIQYWIELLNGALESLWVRAGLSFEYAPFFIFDTNTSLLKLYYPASLVNTTSLYCNQQLQTLLDSFIFTKDKDDKKFYRFEVFNQTGLNNYTNNGNLYYIMYQENTTISLLNPVQSIVFLSGMFPIQQSLLSPPKVFGSDSSLFNGGNNANLTPLLTDFEINVTNLNTYKESIEYTPTAEYRLIDLFGRTPLTHLQIEVVWKDKFNNFHPFILNSGCCCNLKLMFRRKDFNAVDLDI